MIDAPTKTDVASTGRGPPCTRLGVDVGGTFTDLVALVDGSLVTAKVGSTPEDQSLGVIESIRASGIDPSAVTELAHGMTVATNALLERRGARTALVATEGFRDLLEICRQNRPSLYDLRQDRPPALVPRELRFTVRERMGPAGVLTPIDADSVQDVVDALRREEVEAVAVCLLFSFMHPAHEEYVGAAIRAALPTVRVSLSCRVLPELREFERSSTVVADAYLAPRLSSYLGELERKVRHAGIPAPLVMQSSGGVVEIEAAIEGAASCVLSGPAGGVVGAAFIAGESGYDDVLTFDMGGTSTDVAAVLNGKIEVTTEAHVAGVPIKFPMVDIHTVSAGGGSIAHVDDGGALRVGPRSAGAVPGPVSYGRGGSEPTVTDANVLLGYLADELLIGGEIRLERARAEQTYEALAAQLGMSPVEAAQGVIRVADAEMTRALRVISVERGLDPREFALVAFGGAGPLHACSLAEELDIPTVLVPKASGVLSALGLAISDLRRDYAISGVGADPVELTRRFHGLEDRARSDLASPRVQRLADVRYRGQSFELTVDAGELEGLESRFHAAHERRYGYRMEEEAVEIINLRVAAVVTRARPQLREAGCDAVVPIARRLARFDAEWIEVAVHDRRALGRGSRLAGPAIVEFPEATCLIRPAWAGEIDASGTLVLERR